VPDVTLGELRLLACPADERIRHAHPGAGMLTMAAASGSGGTPAAVTDVAAGPTCGAQVAADMAAIRGRRDGSASHAEL
jgi:hypothetical protein